jgi:hypothetical protein
LDTSDAGVEVADANAAIDAGPDVTEAQARAVMARAFRAAGLRIREDLVVAGVTLDGGDPARKVGYEYVAVEERGLDMTPQARKALAAEDGWRVLIVEATDAAGLRARVDAFVSAELGPPKNSESGR